MEQEILSVENLLKQSKHENEILMQRMLGLDMQIKNLAREKDNTTDAMRQMKEDRVMADREIINLQNLNDTVV